MIHYLPRPRRPNASAKFNERRRQSTCHRYCNFFLHVMYAEFECDTKLIYNVIGYHSICS